MAASQNFGKMQNWAEFDFLSSRRLKNFGNLAFDPPPLRRVEKGEGGRGKNFVYNRVGFVTQII